MPETWYVEVAGRTLGPLSAAGLRREAMAGRLQTATRVRHGADGEWVEAGNVPGLFPTDSLPGRVIADKESRSSANATVAPSNSQPTAAAETATVSFHTATPIQAASPNCALPDVDWAEPPTTATHWQRIARRLAAPWSVSLVAHAALLLVLGLWLVPMMVASPGEVNVVLDSASKLSPEELSSATAAIPATSTEANALTATASASSFHAPLADLPPLNIDLAEMAASDVATSSRDMLRGMKTGDLGTESPFIPPRSAREGGVAAADGVDEAVAGILGDIDGRLAEGNLLVVWLLDASISLVDDRRQIAQRLEPFYQGIGIRDKKTQTVFSNAVVAFGNQTKELVKPTHFNGKIVRAVNNVPIDESGLENVMTAVEQCVHKYRGRWKDDMLIVVWTDESGDDILRLEQTIRLCREQRVVVTVVGPSSVLGSERGSHQYTDPASGFSFLLPVKRGPDTSLPERLMIPYWHASLFNAWQKNGAVVAQGVQGFGGPHRERLLSGFGPYALTRLALQTGGSFTLLDRPADRGPFDLHKLRDYLPDYNAAEHYLQETQSQPLRQAVSTAVMRTYHEAFSHPPTMGFFGAGAMRYPFGMSAVYLPPTRFRDMLAESLPAEERRAAAALRIIEQGLADFDGQTDYEALYEEEDSRRWRAWYDLTRGRLLANSVRYQEYLLACQLVRNGAGQNSETNHVVLRPAEEFISQGSRQRAEQAGRLLNRCIEENPSTPWALLAQWELEYPLGLRIESSVIPRPPPAVAAPAAGAGGGGVSLPKL